MRNKNPVQLLSGVTFHSKIEALLRERGAQRSVGILKIKDCSYVL